MSIRTLLQEIAAAWPAYHRQGTVNSADPVYQLVTTALPDEIRPHLPRPDYLRVEGSTGAGNITAAPWIGVFDPRVTKSATAGYYVVYLYAIDLSSVTLCIAFGTTQFEKQFGQAPLSFGPMRAAAVRLQDLYRHVVPEGYSREPINLGATRAQRLHYAYEQSAIFSIRPYKLEALPSEDRLVRDLQGIVEVYTAIVSDPLTPSLDQLLQATIPPAEAITRIDLQEFEPRAPKTPRGPTQSKGTQRYSPESRKVGSAGEQAVLRYEREKLTNFGRPELAEQVRWHTEHGEFPGWDITSFNETGDKIFIEVKSSIGNAISSVNLTSNEWDAAKREANRYFIYIVSKALSAIPSIERLRNPFGFVDRAELKLTPVVFELSLAALS